MRHVARNKKSGDSLAMDISALAISGGSSLSERTKLDRDLLVEGRGKKCVLVDCSEGLKEVEETMDSSPPEDWRSWMAGGRSLSLFGTAVGCVGDVEVVAVVVAVVVVIVVGGGGEVVQVIFLSSSSSLALVVVAMVGSWAAVIEPKTTKYDHGRRLTDDSRPHQSCSLCFGVVHRLRNGGDDELQDSNPDDPQSRGTPSAHLSTLDRLLTHLFR